MKERILKVMSSRIRKLLICCVALSALVSVLCVMKLLPDKSSELVIGLNVAAALFVLMAFFQMRSCYVKLANKSVYYISNICACVLFAMINLIAYFLLPGKAYTWLFGITKVARYTMFNLTSFHSALVFHSIVTGCVFVAPVGMGWIFVEKAERKAKMAKLPPELKVNPLENKTDNEELKIVGGANEK